MCGFDPGLGTEQRGELVGITGENGEASFMMLSEDALAAEYDVDIEEAPQTPEDKSRRLRFWGCMRTSWRLSGTAERRRRLCGELAISACGWGCSAASCQGFDAFR